jgi:hypothetical protein
LAITFTNLGASANPDINSSANATSYANSSWTPPTSGLIILAVGNRQVNDGTEIVTPTVSGNGLTWTQIDTQPFSLNSGFHRQRVTLFAANASGSSAGATTISFSVGQERCNASFFLVEGVDLSGGVAGAFVQVVKDNSTAGGDGLSLSLTLASASHADNRPILAMAENDNNAVTPRTNWTEMDDLAGASTNLVVETQVREDTFETTASASWSLSGAWGAIAAELKADTGGGGTTTLTADHGSFTENGQAGIFSVTMISGHGSYT